jgi:hypothetical protein
MFDSISELVARRSIQLSNPSPTLKIHLLSRPALVPCSLACLIATAWIGWAMPAWAQQLEPAKALDSFEATGDSKYLISFAEAMSGDHAKEGAVGPDAVPQQAAALYLRALIAIQTRCTQLMENGAGRMARMEAFQKEKQKRTDQPFVNPGYTKPEDIPDADYRQRYVQHLADMKESAQQAQIYSGIHSFEASFRRQVETLMQRLPRDRQKELIARTPVERLSPEVRKVLGESLHLTLEPRKGGNVFYVGHTRDELKETELESYFNLRTAKLFACKYAPHETFAVLVRGGTCYVLNDTRHDEELFALLVHPGDQMFEFKRLDDLKDLKLPVLSGPAASAELFRQAKVQTEPRVEK